VPAHDAGLHSLGCVFGLRIKGRTNFFPTDANVILAQGGYDCSIKAIEIMAAVPALARNKGYFLGFC
jgi:hypothetical protein